MVGSVCASDFWWLVYITIQGCFKLLEGIVDKELSGLWLLYNIWFY